MMRIFENRILSSLERSNKIDFKGRLAASGVGNWRDHAGLGREKMLGEMTGIGGHFRGEVET